MGSNILNQIFFIIKCYPLQEVSQKKSQGGEGRRSEKVKNLSHQCPYYALHINHYMKNLGLSLNQAKTANLE